MTSRTVGQEGHCFLVVYSFFSGVLDYKRDAEALFTSCESRANHN